MSKKSPPSESSSLKSHKTKDIVSRSCISKHTDASSGETSCYSEKGKLEKSSVICEYCYIGRPHNSHSKMKLLATGKLPDAHHIKVCGRNSESKSRSQKNSSRAGKHAEKSNAKITLYGQYLENTSKASNNLDSKDSSKHTSHQKQAALPRTDSFDESHLKEKTKASTSELCGSIYPSKNHEQEIETGDNDFADFKSAPLNSEESNVFADFEHATFSDSPSYSCSSEIVDKNGSSLQSCSPSVSGVLSKENQKQARKVEVQRIQLDSTTLSQLGYVDGTKTQNKVAQIMRTAFPSEEIDKAEDTESLDVFKNSDYNLEERSKRLLTLFTETEQSVEPQAFHSRWHETHAFQQMLCSLNIDSRNVYC